ncbi:MAG: hypothetical protein ABJB12_19405 [Pseudomonadota bacterium]
MTYDRRTKFSTMCSVASSLLVAAACSSGGSNGDGMHTGAAGAGQGGASTGPVATAGSNSAAGASAGTPGAVAGGSNGGATGTAGSGQNGGTSGVSGGAGAGAGGQHAGGAGGGSAGAGGGSAGAGGSGGGSVVSNCVGKAWPTADPTAKGTFEVTADKGVGPLAGAVPDPVYGNTQQHFNVYRPKDLATSGYCHPILVWANGHTDNPEPNPPDCVSSKYCGSYLTLMQQMASHGFVVIASLSTITSQGTPLPTITGLDWLLQQAEDSTSPYYHHLDTAHIGAFGHSEGGFSTSKAASDPRISAISTVSGSAANPGFHQPSLWFCGGKDMTVKCASVAATYSSITTQPSMMIDNLASDHGGWLYQSDAKGPDFFGMTAWFRYYLMGDVAQKSYFFGADCKFCKDSRVTVMQNSFMTQ